MDFLAAEDALPAGALLLDNTDDVLARAADIRRHEAVVLRFPKWTDGRAYSQAVLLRGRLHYAGQIVATGDIVADMAPLLRRCGFDHAQLRADQRLETARRALGLVDAHYQQTLAERHRVAGAGASATPAPSATSPSSPASPTSATAA